MMAMRKMHSRNKNAIYLIALIFVALAAVVFVCFLAVMFGSVEKPMANSSAAVSSQAY
jgi:hypothetical protein